MVWTVHLIDWLSLHHLVVFFLKLLPILSFGPFFFSQSACYVKRWSLRCSPGRGNPHHCAVTPYVGEGSEREQWHLLCSLPIFNHFPQLPSSKLGLSGADSQVGEFVYVLRPCGSLQRTLLWGWEFLPLPPKPPQVFSVRGFETLFPCTGTLSSISAPPTGLGECFFISLVVRLPCSSIFCQFWGVVLNLWLSFFWLCEEAQCVYLHLHLGQKSESEWLTFWWHIFILVAVLIMDKVASRETS